MCKKIEAWGYAHGHLVLYDSDNWRYEDGKLSNKARACTRCGNMPTKEGHDHCISNLPNVVFACCGHGKKNGYFTLNGKRHEFDTNTNRLEIIKMINNL